MGVSHLRLSVFSLSVRLPFRMEEFGLYGSEPKELKK